jgi:hypothetical protein
MFGFAVSSGLCAADSSKGRCLDSQLIRSGMNEADENDDSTKRNRSELAEGIEQLFLHFAVSNGRIVES